MSKETSDFRVEDGFKVEHVSTKEKGMKVDKIVTFNHEKSGKVQAVYYYYKGKCNYLLSWGFDKNTLGELRSSKASKAKKPFFSLSKGWFGYE